MRFHELKRVKCAGLSTDTSSDGSGSNSYNSVAIELQASTEYFIKAYATNSSGTGYGNEISFVSPSCNSEITVINNLDNGYGSLREAIDNICENGIITISSDIDGQNINLTSGILNIDKVTTIDNSNHTTGLSITSNNGQTLSISSGSQLLLSPQGLSF